MAKFTGHSSEIRELVQEELERLAHDQLLRHAFEKAAIGMAIVSLQGKFLKVNEALCTLTGYLGDELRGQLLRDLTYPDDIDVRDQLLGQALDGARESFQLEGRYVRKDSTIVWGMAGFSLVRHDSGTPLYFVFHIQDITDRKLHEQHLEESGLRYQSLLKHNPDMICTLDENGTLVQVNPAAVRTTGYSKEELIGHSALPFIAVEDWKTAWSLFGRAKQGKIGSAELTFMHKNGRPIVLEVSFVPMIIHKYVNGIYLLAKDITKRKISDATIEKLNVKNQLILDAVSDGIFGIDQHHGTIFWNEAAERITGYSYEDMTGKNAYEILTRTQGDKEAAEKGQSPSLLSMHEGVYYHNASEVFYTKNGDLFPVEYMTSPMYDHGRMIGVVITFKDITERLKTEELLRKSEKLSVVGQIAAGVAHEIRNPLTSLKGFIQFLQAGAPNKEEYFQIMLSELSRIELIITEMLVLAKPQMQNFQPKSVEAILHNVVTLLESQANLSDVQFVMSIEPDLPNIWCEENQLKQTFINLIKNAMEAMPEGGHIDIKVSSDRGEWLKITVKDHGCGIPQEVLARLGEPFYTTKEKGTGLGFMISYKIIEDHRGHMMVESKVGEGTVISVSLPVTMD
ncbi:PAS domain S-box protein [Paenibacillus hexagrammi]|uniref:histidine kinase n=1 Tax=Paenibacillus hexagrammi TaxID=2908839 RepID=A0ABY3SN63_9BACL|nr:PAS domain S-box protein [Paenibacillus sp. YPD9-1]UJF34674.1 PAS domain S-box protein [Paenibacillus sp. YPD9-1]